MVQGQQHQQQQTNTNATNYLSNQLLATTDPNRVQSEKVKLNSIVFIIFKIYFRKQQMHF